MDRKHGSGDPPIRLDGRGEILRWILLGFAVVLLGFGVKVALVDGEPPWTSTGGGILILGGAVCAGFGLAYRRSYFTPQGLQRVGWLGRTVIPWSAIEVVELDEYRAPRHEVGLIRLRRASGRAVTIRMTPAEVGRHGGRIACACPQAFVDDRRTGRVTPPREGDEARVRDLQTVVRVRAARRHLVMGSVWIATGILGILGAVLAAALQLRKNPIPTLLVMAALGFGAYEVFQMAAKRLRLAARVRRGPADRDSRA